MTAKFYKNIIYSIRKWCHSINDNVWYLDEHNETMSENTFYEVSCSTGRTEDEHKWYYYDFININVFSKEETEEATADIVEEIENRLIPVENLLEAEEDEEIELLGYIQIERVETNLLGRVGKYLVKNISVYYKIIGGD